MVHEKVLAAVIGSNKTVALLDVEPLDRTLRHSPSPAFLFWAPQQQSPLLLLHPQYTRPSNLKVRVRMRQLALLHPPTAADRLPDESGVVPLSGPACCGWSIRSLRNCASEHVLLRVKVPAELPQQLA